MSRTYISTEQLAERIQYHPRTIRHELVDQYLFEGTHYVRAFGRRKLLFIWEEVEKTMLQGSSDSITMPTVEA